MTDLPFAEDAKATCRANPLGVLIDWVNRRFDLSLQHAALSELDDDRLTDIGLTRDDVRRLRPRWFRQLRTVGPNTFRSPDASTGVEACRKLPRSPK